MHEMLGINLDVTDSQYWPAQVLTKQNNSTNTCRCRREYMQRWLASYVTNPYWLWDSSISLFSFIPAKMRKKGQHVLFADYSCSAHTQPGAYRLLRATTFYPIYTCSDSRFLIYSRKRSERRPCMQVRCMMRLAS